MLKDGKGRTVDLEAENKRLEGRIAELLQEIVRLEKRPDYTKGVHDVSEFYPKDNG